MSDLFELTFGRPKDTGPKTSLSQSELEDVLRQAGWDEKLIPTMAAIGMAESALDKNGKAKVNSYNPGLGAGGKPSVEKSYGIWQINMHPSLGRNYDINRLQSDPLYNAKVAKEIYSQQGLKAWGAYKDERYKKFLKKSVVPETYNQQNNGLQKLYRPDEPITPPLVPSAFINNGMTEPILPLTKKAQPGNGVLTSDIPRTVSDPNASQTQASVPQQSGVVVDDRSEIQKLGKTPQNFKDPKKVEDALNKQKNLLLNSLIPQPNIATTSPFLSNGQQDNRLQLATPATDQNVAIPSTTKPVDEEGAVNVDTYENVDNIPYTESTPTGKVKGYSNIGDWLNSKYKYISVDLSNFPEGVERNEAILRRVLSGALQGLNYTPENFEKALANSRWRTRGTNGVVSFEDFVTNPNAIDKQKGKFTFSIDRRLINDVLTGDPSGKTIASELQADWDEKLLNSQMQNAMDKFNSDQTVMTQEDIDQMKNRELAKEDARYDPQREENLRKQLQEQYSNYEENISFEKVADEVLKGPITALWDGLERIIEAYNESQTPGSTKANKQKRIDDKVQAAIDDIKNSYGTIGAYERHNEQLFGTEDTWINFTNNIAKTTGRAGGQFVQGFFADNFAPMLKFAAIVGGLLKYGGALPGGFNTDGSFKDITKSDLWKSGEAMENTFREGLGGEANGPGEKISRGIGQVIGQMVLSWATGGGNLFGTELAEGAGVFQQAAQQARLGHVADIVAGTKGKWLSRLEYVTNKLGITGKGMTSQMGKANQIEIVKDLIKQGYEKELQIALTNPIRAGRLITATSYPSLAVESFNTAKQEGASDPQAIAFGLLMGYPMAKVENQSEVALAKIFNGFKIVDKASGGKFAPGIIGKLKKFGETKWGTVLKSAAELGGIEQLEEITQNTIPEWTANKLFSKEQKKFVSILSKSISQTGEVFWTGALTGVGGTISEIKQKKDSEKEIIDRANAILGDKLQNQQQEERINLAKQLADQAEKVINEAKGLTYQPTKEEKRRLNLLGYKNKDIEQLSEHDVAVAIKKRLKKNVLGPVIVEGNNIANEVFADKLAETVKADESHPLRALWQEPDQRSEEDIKWLQSNKLVDENNEITQEGVHVIYGIGDKVFPNINDEVSDQKSSEPETVETAATQGEPDLEPEKIKEIEDAKEKIKAKQSAEVIDGETKGVLDVVPKKNKTRETTVEEQPKESKDITELTVDEAAHIEEEAPKEKKKPGRKSKLDEEVTLYNEANNFDNKKARDTWYEAKADEHGPQIDFNTVEQQVNSENPKSKIVANGSLRTLKNSDGTLRVFPGFDSAANNSVLNFVWKHTYELEGVKSNSDGVLSLADNLDPAKWELIEPATADKDGNIIKKGRIRFVGAEKSSKTETAKGLTVEPKKTKEESEAKPAKEEKPVDKAAEAKAEREKLKKETSIFPTYADWIREQGPQYDFNSSGQVTEDGIPYKLREIPKHLSAETYKKEKAEHDAINQFSHDTPIDKVGNQKMSDVEGFMLDINLLHENDPAQAAADIENALDGESETIDRLLKEDLPKSTKNFLEARKKEGEENRKAEERSIDNIFDEPSTFSHSLKIVTDEGKKVIIEQFSSVEDQASNKDINRTEQSKTDRADSVTERETNNAIRRLRRFSIKKSLGTKVKNPAVDDRADFIHSLLAYRLKNFNEAREVVNQLIQQREEYYKLDESDDASFSYSIPSLSYTPPYTLTSLSSPEFVGLRNKSIKLETLKQKIKAARPNEGEKIIFDYVLGQLEGQDKVFYNDFESKVRITIIPTFQVTLGNWLNNYPQGERFKHWGMNRLDYDRFDTADINIYNSPYDHGMLGHWFEPMVDQNLYSFPIYNVVELIHEGETYYGVAPEHLIDQYIYNHAIGKIDGIFVTQNKEEAKAYADFFSRVGMGFKTAHSGLMFHTRIWTDKHNNGYLVEVQTDVFGKIDTREQNASPLANSMDYLSTSFNIDKNGDINYKFAGEVFGLSKAEYLVLSNHINTILNADDPAARKLISNEKYHYLSQILISFDKLWKEFNGFPSTNELVAFFSQYSEVHKKDFDQIIKNIENSNRTEEEQKEEIDKLYDVASEHQVSLNSRTARLNREIKEIKLIVRSYLNKYTTPFDKQFIANGKYISIGNNERAEAWAIRALREEVKRMATMKYSTLRVSTPLTSAIIQGYIKPITENKYRNDIFGKNRGSDMPLKGILTLEPYMSAYKGILKRYEVLNKVAKKLYPNAKYVVDEQGYSWIEIPLTQEQENESIVAFSAIQYQHSSELLHQLAKKETKLDEEFIGNVKSKLDRHGDLWINEYSSELLRRTYTVIKGKEVTPFDGQFLRREQFPNILARLEDFRDNLKLAGYTTEDIKGVNDLISNLKHLYKNNTGILYVNSDRVPHEQAHKFRYINSNYETRRANFYNDFDDLFDRLEDLERKGFRYLKEAYFGKRIAFKNLTQAQKAHLHDEIFSWIAEGRWEQIGFTQQEAEDFIETDLDAYVEKNGTNILGDLRGLINEKAEIIPLSQAVAAIERAQEEYNNARGGLETKTEGREGSAIQSINDAKDTERALGDGIRDSSKKQIQIVKLRSLPLNIAEEGEFDYEELPESVREYVKVDKKEEIKKARAWLKEVGIKNAITEAQLNHEATAQNVARRKAVLNFINDQIAHHYDQGNIPTAQYWNEQLLKVTASFSEDATNWGQAISQLFEHDNLNPGQTIAQIQEKMRVNGNTFDLSDQQRVREMIRKMSHLEDEINDLLSQLEDTPDDIAIEAALGVLRDTLPEVKKSNDNPDNVEINNNDDQAFASVNKPIERNKTNIRDVLTYLDLAASIQTDSLEDIEDESFSFDVSKKLSDDPWKAGLWDTVKHLTEQRKDRFDIAIETYYLQDYGKNYADELEHISNITGIDINSAKQGLEQQLRNVSGNFEKVLNEIYERIELYEKHEKRFESKYFVNTIPDSPLVFFRDRMYEQGFHSLGTALDKVINNDKLREAFKYYARFGQLTTYNPWHRGISNLVTLDKIPIERAVHVLNIIQKKLPKFKDGEVSLKKRTNSVLKEFFPYFHDEVRQILERDIPPENFYKEYSALVAGDTLNGRKYEQGLIDKNGRWYIWQDGDQKSLMKNVSSTVWCFKNDYHIDNYLNTDNDSYLDIFYEFNPNTGIYEPKVAISRYNSYYTEGVADKYSIQQIGGTEDESQRVPIQYANETVARLDRDYKDATNYDRERNKIWALNRLSEINKYHIEHGTLTDEYFNEIFDTQSDVVRYVGSRNPMLKSLTDIYGQQFRERIIKSTLDSHNIISNYNNSSLPVFDGSNQKNGDKLKEFTDELEKLLNEAKTPQHVILPNSGMFTFNLVYAENGIISNTENNVEKLQHIERLIKLLTTHPNVKYFYVARINAELNNLQEAISVKHSFDSALKNNLGKRAAIQSAFGSANVFELDMPYSVNETDTSKYAKSIYEHILNNLERIGGVGVQLNKNALRNSGNWHSVGSNRFIYKHAEVNIDKESLTLPKVNGDAMLIELNDLTLTGKIKNITPHRDNKFYLSNVFAPTVELIENTSIKISDRKELSTYIDSITAYKSLKRLKNSNIYTATPLSLDNLEILTDSYIAHSAVAENISKSLSLLDANQVKDYFGVYKDVKYLHETRGESLEFIEKAALEQAEKNNITKVDSNFFGIKPINWTQNAVIHQYSPSYSSDAGVPGVGTGLKVFYEQIENNYFDLFKGPKGPTTLHLLGDIHIIKFPDDISELQKNMREFQDMLKKYIPAILKGVYMPKLHTIEIVNEYQPEYTGITFGSDVSITTRYPHIDRNGGVRFTNTVFEKNISVNNYTELKANLILNASVIKGNEIKLGGNQLFLLNSYIPNKGTLTIDAENKPSKKFRNRQPYELVTDLNLVKPSISILGTAGNISKLKLHTSGSIIINGNSFEYLTDIDTTGGKETNFSPISITSRIDQGIEYHKVIGAKNITDENAHTVLNKMSTAYQGYPKLQRLKFSSEYDSYPELLILVDYRQPKFTLQNTELNKTYSSKETYQVYPGKTTAEIYLRLIDSMNTAYHYNVFDKLYSAQEIPFYGSDDYYTGNIKYSLDPLKNQIITTGIAQRNDDDPFIPTVSTVGHGYYNAIANRGLLSNFINHYRKGKVNYRYLGEHYSDTGTGTGTFTEDNNFDFNTAIVKAIDRKRLIDDFGIFDFNNSPEIGLTELKERLNELALQKNKEGVQLKSENKKDDEPIQPVNWHDVNNPDLNLFDDEFELQFEDDWDDDFSKDISEQKYSDLAKQQKDALVVVSSNVFRKLRKKGPVRFNDWKAALRISLNQSGFDTSPLKNMYGPIFTDMLAYHKQQGIDKSIKKIMEKEKVNKAEATKIYEKRLEARAKSLQIAAENRKLAEEKDKKLSSLYQAIDNVIEGTPFTREDVLLARDRNAFFARYAGKISPNEITNMYLETVLVYIQAKEELQELQSENRKYRLLRQAGINQGYTQAEVDEILRKADEKKKEQARISNDFRKLENHLTKRPSGIIGRTTNWYYRLNKAGEAALTSALQTASHNLMSQKFLKSFNTFEMGVELTFAKLGLFGEDDQSISKGVSFKDLGLNELKGMSFPQIRAAIDELRNGQANFLSAMLTAFNHKDQVVQGILAYNPDIYDEMMEQFSYGSEADFIKPTDPNIGKTAQFIENRVKNVEKYIHYITFFNRLQEKHFRFATFLATLDSDLKGMGYDLNKMIESGDVGAIPRNLLKRAATRALEDTLGQDIPKEWMVTRTVSTISSFMSWMPFFLNPMLFRRFAFSSFKFTFEHSPAVLLKIILKRDGKHTLTRRDMAKFTTGMMLFGFSWMLAEMFGTDDDDPTKLKIGDYNVEMTSYNPVTVFLVFGMMAKRMRQGKPPVPAAGQLMRIFGQDPRYPNLALEFYKSLFNLAGPDYNSSKTVFEKGEILGAKGLLAFLRPLITLKDIVAQFDEEERIRRNYAGEGAWGELKRAIPFSEKLQKLIFNKNSDPYIDVITGKPQEKLSPLLNQLGLTFISEYETGPKFTPAQEFLHYYARETRDTYERWRSPEERKASYLTAQLFTQLDKGQNITAQITKFFKQGKITERQALMLAKASEYNSLTFRKAIENGIVPIYQASLIAVDENERNDLKNAMKFKLAGKKVKLKAEEIDAVKSLLPELKDYDINAELGLSKSTANQDPDTYDQEQEEDE